MIMNKGIFLHCFLKETALMVLFFIEKLTIMCLMSVRFYYGKSTFCTYYFVNKNLELNFVLCCLWEYTIKFHSLENGLGSSQ